MRSPLAPRPYRDRPSANPRPKRLPTFPTRESTQRRGHRNAQRAPGRCPWRRVRCGPNAHTGRVSPARVRTAGGTTSRLAVSSPPCPRKGTGSLPMTPCGWNRERAGRYPILSQRAASPLSLWCLLPVAKVGLGRPRGPCAGERPGASSAPRRIPFGRLPFFPAASPARCP